MIGFMAAQLMHRKLRRDKKSTCKENEDSTNRMPAKSVPVKEKLTKQNEKQATCRVCLKVGDIPIYGSEDMSEALSSFGAITINQEDKYPKHICQDCYSLLQSAISFRETAQKSDEILRRPQKGCHVMSYVEDSRSNSSYSEYESVHTKATTPEKLDEIVRRPHKDTSDIEDSRYSDGSDSEFREHTQAEKRKVYHCQRCNIDFDTFKDYSIHRLSKEHICKKHTCPICKKSYSSKSYSRHLAIHEKDTQYICDICGKNFKIKGQLTRHRAIHFNNFPFKCSLCPYKGRFNESLRWHMRTHTGEKPFQCTECSTSFAHKSNLNKHLIIHKGKNDFKCDPCGRGFYTKRELDLHLIIDHTGVKDHVCDICGKGFGYRHQMTKHQLKVHKRKKLKCGRVPLYLQIESQDKTE